MTKKKRKKKQTIAWSDLIKEQASKLIIDVQKLREVEDLPCGKQLPQEPNP